MNITPIIKFDRGEMVDMRILLLIDYGVYVCICKVYSDVFKGYKIYAFVYEIRFSTLEKCEFFGAIIGNRSYAPILYWKKKIEKAHMH